MIIGTRAMGEVIEMNNLEKHYNIKEIHDRMDYKPSELVYKLRGAGNSPELSGTEHIKYYKKGRLLDKLVIMVRVSEGKFAHIRAVTDYEQDAIKLAESIDRILKRKTTIKIGEIPFGWAL